MLKNLWNVKVCVSIKLDPVMEIAQICDSGNQVDGYEYDDYFDYEDYDEYDDGYDYDDYLEYYDYDDYDNYDYVAILTCNPTTPGATREGFEPRSSGQQAHPSCW